MGVVRPLGRGREVGWVSLIHRSSGCALDLCLFKRDLCRGPFCGAFIGQVGRVGRVGRRDGAPEGCHSASPRSRLAEPKTGGLRLPQIPRPLRSHKTHPSATARVDDIYRALFPPVVRGRLPPPTRGLAEWHPVGCGWGAFPVRSGTGPCLR